MKTGNKTYGIDFEPMEAAKRKWYRWARFPLLPITDWSSADEWNTGGFSFSWLNIRLWTMDSFDFTFQFSIEDVGIFIRVKLPYLNIYFWLLIFPESWHQKLWRKPKAIKFPN